MGCALANYVIFERLCGKISLIVVAVHDEFWIRMLADHELVFVNNFKAMASIKANRAVILLINADVVMLKAF